MEAATTPEITPETLRADAERCRHESERLRERVLKLRAEAMRLDREAGVLETALALAPPKPARIPAHVQLAGDVAVWLRRQRKPKSSTEIAEALDATIAQVRPALKWLIGVEVIRQDGLKRGTRYRYARETDASMPSPFGQRWQEVVRDKAIELETFTLAEIDETLPTVTTATVARWVAKLVEDGLFVCERIDGRNLYAYEPPAPSAVPRRVNGTPIGVGSGASRPAVQGNGESKIARREVRELVQAAKAAGASIREQKHGYAIVLEGETIAAIPRTPSDHRSLKNARAALARAGIL